ncbi:MAG: hypothetical protein WAZ14_01340 [Patescibacteria group bacterium]
MPIDRLAIPLSVNPARQQLWRAIGLSSSLILSVLTGLILDRAWHFRTSASIWPTTATSEIRLITTDRITSIVEQTFAGVPAIAATPWDLAEAITWSKREFLLYSDGNRIIGFTVDGEVPTNVSANLKLWNLKTTSFANKTLITSAETPVLDQNERHLDPWLLFPRFDGSVAIKSSNDERIRRLPFRFSKHNDLIFPLNSTPFIAPRAPALAASTELLGAFRVPARVFSNNSLAVIPSNFPGLQILKHITANQDLDVMIGQDSLGPAFVLALTSPNLSLEELGALATEAANLQSLSTSGLTIEGLPDSLEIRANPNVITELNTSDGITTATATAPTGEMFRLTQANNQLIFSNRPSIIDAATTEYPASCLKHPQGFIAPQALKQLLLAPINLNNHDLVTHLQLASQVAYRKNTLKICW